MKEIKKEEQLSGDKVLSKKIDPNIKLADTDNKPVLLDDLMEEYDPEAKKFLDTNVLHSGGRHLSNSKELERLGVDNANYGSDTRSLSDKQLAGLQSTGEIWKRAALGSMVNGIAGFMDNFNYDVVDMKDMWEGKNREYGSWLSKTVKSMQEYSGKEFKVYDDGVFGSQSYWANMSQNTAYTLGLMFGTGVEEVGLTALTELTGGGAASVQASAIMKSAYKLALRSMVHGSLKGIQEGYQNGLETFDTTYQKAIQAGKSHDEAQAMAAEAAHDGYHMEILPLMVINSFQTALVGRAIRGSKGVAAIASAKKGVNTGMGSIVEGLTDVLFSKIDNKAIKGLLSIGAASVSEGFEEGFQSYVSKIARNRALKAGGVYDRVDLYDAEMRDSILIGGLVGGAGHGIRRTLQYLATKGITKERAEKADKFIKGMKMRAALAYEELRKAQESGDELSLARAELEVHNINVANALYHDFVNKEDSKKSIAFDSMMDDFEAALEAAKNKDSKKMKSLGYKGVTTEEQFNKAVDFLTKQIEQAKRLKKEYTTFFKEIPYHPVAMARANNKVYIENLEELKKKFKGKIDDHYNNNEAYNSLDEEHKELVKLFSEHDSLFIYIEESLKQKDKKTGKKIFNKEDFKLERARMKEISEEIEKRKAKRSDESIKNNAVKYDEALKDFWGVINYHTYMHRTNTSLKALNEVAKKYSDRKEIKKIITKDMQDAIDAANTIKELKYIKKSKAAKSVWSKIVNKFKNKEKKLKTEEATEKGKTKEEIKEDKAVESIVKDIEEELGDLDDDGIEDIFEEGEEVAEEVPLDSDEHDPKTIEEAFKMMAAARDLDKAKTKDKFDEGEKDKPHTKKFFNNKSTKLPTFKAIIEEHLGSIITKVSNKDKGSFIELEAFIYSIAEVKNFVNSKVEELNKEEATSDEDISEALDIILKETETETPIVHTESTEHVKALNKKLNEIGLEVDKEYTFEEVVKILNDNILKVKIDVSTLDMVLDIIENVDTIGLDTKIVFSSNSEFFDKLEIDGVYRSKENIILIDAALGSSPHVLARVFAHEMVHAVTLTAVRDILAGKNLDKYTEKQIHAVKNLEALLEELKKDPNFEDEYGATSVEELLAELSDADFVKKLKAKKFEDKSFFEKIVSFIADILGIDVTAFDISKESFMTLITEINFGTHEDSATAPSKRKYKSYNRTEYKADTENKIQEFFDDVIKNRLDKKRKDLVLKKAQENVENAVINDTNYSDRVESLFEVYDDGSKEMDKLLSEIQANYEKAMKRKSTYIGNLEGYLASGNAVFYSPFIGDNSGLAGTTVNDIFIVSHFAPSSLRKGLELIKEASNSHMPIVMAVPEYLANQLEKAGFNFMFEIPQYFNGEIVMKKVMYNNAMNLVDIATLKGYYSKEFSQGDIFNQEDQEDIHAGLVFSKRKTTEEKFDSLKKSGNLTKVYTVINKMLIKEGIIFPIHTELTNLLERYSKAIDKELASAIASSYLEYTNDKKGITRSLDDLVNLLDTEENSNETSQKKINEKEEDRQARLEYEKKRREYRQRNFNDINPANASYEAGNLHIDLNYNGQNKKVLHDSPYMDNLRILVPGKIEKGDRIVLVAEPNRTLPMRKNGARTTYAEHYQDDHTKEGAIGDIPIVAYMLDKDGNKVGDAVFIVHDVDWVEANYKGEAKDAKLREVLALRNMFLDENGNLKDVEAVITEKTKGGRETFDIPQPLSDIFDDNTKHQVGFARVNASGDSFINLETGESLGKGTNNNYPSVEEVRERLGIDSLKGVVFEVRTTSIEGEYEIYALNKQRLGESESFNTVLALLQAFYKNDKALRLAFPSTVFSSIVEFEKYLNSFMKTNTTAFRKASKNSKTIFNTIIEVLKAKVNSAENKPGLPFMITIKGTLYYGKNTGTKEDIMKFVEEVHGALKDLKTKKEKYEALIHIANKFGVFVMNTRGNTVLDFKKFIEQDLYDETKPAVLTNFTPTRYKGRLTKDNNNPKGIPQFFWSIDENGNKILELDTEGQLDYRDYMMQNLKSHARGFSINVDGEEHVISDVHNTTTFTPIDNIETESVNKKESKLSDTNPTIIESEVDTEEKPKPKKEKVVVKEKNEDYNELTIHFTVEDILAEVRKEYEECLKNN